MNKCVERYVSFETAKLLKEKGFDECPLFRYDDCGQLWVQGGYDKTIKWHFPAPTLQMTMDWLRINHGIIIEPSFALEEKDIVCSCSVFTLEENHFEYQYETDYIEYENAIEESIKYALENLIQYD